MKIQKMITLLGDRLRLCFFVDEDNYYRSDKAMMWFEDDRGESILGDSYNYYITKSNKKEIKADLKECFPNEKELYKELILLINEMRKYEYSNFQ